MKTKIEVEKANRIQHANRSPIRQHSRGRVALVTSSRAGTTHPLPSSVAAAGHCGTSDQNREEGGSGSVPRRRSESRHTRSEDVGRTPLSRFGCIKAGGRAVVALETCRGSGRARRGTSISNDWRSSDSAFLHGSAYVETQRVSLNKAECFAQCRRNVDRRSVLQRHSKREHLEEGPITAIVICSQLSIPARCSLLRVCSHLRVICRVFALVVTRHDTPSHAKSG